MSMLIRIAVLGEIGSGNTGDDHGFILLRDELVRAFGHFDVDIHVDYLTPARFSDLDSANYPVVITGCGTLLDLRGGEYVARLATMQARGTIISTLGTGLSDPAHLKPTDEGRALLDVVLAKCTKGWVRGVTGPDLMWIKGWVAPGSEPSHTVGINMGYAAFSCENLSLIWSKIRSLIWHLRTHGRQVTLVSCWKNDDVWYRRDFPDDPVMRVDGSRSSVEKLGSLHTLVSFRGHLGILATCAGVSTLPIIFSTKVADMYRNTEIAPQALYPSEDGWLEVVEGTMAKGPLNLRTQVLNAQESVRTKVYAFAEAVVSRF